MKAAEYWMGGHSANPTKILPLRGKKLRLLRKYE
jgi:hypothetical protein